MGRQVKPTALKLLQGTARADRCSPYEPTAEVSIPDMPPILAGDAAIEWERVTKQLQSMGMVTQVDMALLAVYCQAWGDFCEAVRVINRDGYTIKSKRGGGRRNPMLTVKQQACEILIQTAAHFGLSPAARAKMMAPQAKQRDKFEEFLAIG